MTNTGEFQGTGRFFHWSFSGSCCSAACTFPDVRGSCSTHTGLSVNPFKGRAVGASERAAAVVPSYVQPEHLVTVLDNYLLVFFSEAGVSFSFVSEVGGMLICVFHCCNKSQPHNLIVLPPTYGFSFPICPSGSIPSTQLALCFTWDKVPVPKNWTFTSWRGQSRRQDFDEMIVKSVPVSSKPSIIMPCICIFSFGLDHL